MTMKWHWHKAISFGQQRRRVEQTAEECGRPVHMENNFDLSEMGTSLLLADYNNEMVLTSFANEV